MNIALLAQDSKKELMVRLCIAYNSVFSRHKLCSTANTGNLIEKDAGLKVTKFLDGKRGGCQQISSRISCGELDMLIFFRDPIHPELMEQEEHDVLRLADLHTIPSATNIATAEILIHGLERGDLDWRNVGRPQF